MSAGNGSFPSPLVCSFLTGAGLSPFVFPGGHRREIRFRHGRDVFSRLRTVRQHCGRCRRFGRGCPPAAASLVSEAVVKTLREALTKAAGHDFAVHFAARERRDDELTVTKVVETEKLKARRAMVEAFKSDPFVQKCVQKIGSEVIETSVRLLTFDEIKDFEANAWKYSRLVGSGPENAEKR